MQARHEEELDGLTEQRTDDGEIMITPAPVKESPDRWAESREVVDKVMAAALEYLGAALSLHKLVGNQHEEVRTLTYIGFAASALTERIGILSAAPLRNLRDLCVTEAGFDAEVRRGRGSISEWQKICCRRSVCRSIVAGPTRRSNS